MKKSIRLECESCNRKRFLNTGLSRNFPAYYLEMTDYIRQGECGVEYKNFFMSNPGAAVDLEDDVYLCESCGKIERMPRMTLYIHKNNEATAKGYCLPEELFESGNYDMVREYQHKCPACADDMTVLETDTDRRFKCPQCKADALMAVLVK